VEGRVDSRGRYPARHVPGPLSSNRFSAGSMKKGAGRLEPSLRRLSVIARWLPPGFNNGLDPDTTEGAIDLAMPANLHVEYVRVEPPAFRRPSGAASGRAQCLRGRELHRRAGGGGEADPVAYRELSSGRHPAKAVLELAAEKAGWGKPLPKGVAAAFRPARLRDLYGQVAEVEVSKDGAVRVRRVVCAVDCAPLSIRYRPGPRSRAGSSSASPRRCVERSR